MVANRSMFQSVSGAILVSALDTHLIILCAEERSSNQQLRSMNALRTRRHKHKCVDGNQKVYELIKGVNVDCGPINEKIIPKMSRFSNIKMKH